LVAPAALRAQQRPAGVPLSQLGGLASRFVSAETMARLMDQPDGLVDSVSFSGPIDTVWAALKTSLGKLDLPIGFADPASRQIGLDQGKVYNRIGGSRISDFLHCGDGPTGPKADSYVVYLSYLSILREQPDHRVALYTLVGATAVDLAGGRNDPVNCGTTGRLEQNIGKQLEKVLKSGK
jgi:hypothetical protein